MCNQCALTSCRRTFVGADGGDTCRMDHGFIGCDVELQVWFMNTPHTTPRGAERRASSLAGRAVDLVAAISIIIPRPLVHTMTDSGMRWMVPPIALPRVGRALRVVSGEVLRHQCRAGLPIGLVGTPEAWLARVPRDDTDQRRTIVGVGPLPSPRMGTPTRRISGVRMRPACFPRVVAPLIGLKGPDFSASSLRPSQQRPSVSDFAKVLETTYT